MDISQNIEFIELMEKIQNQLNFETTISFGEMTSVLNKNLFINGIEKSIYFHKQYFFEENDEFVLNFHYSHFHDFILVTLNIKSHDIFDKIFVNLNEFEKFINRIINYNQIKNSSLPHAFLNLLSVTALESFHNTFYQGLKQKEKLIHESIAEERKSVKDLTLKKIELEEKNTMLQLLKNNNDKENLPINELNAKIEYLTDLVQNLIINIGEIQSASIKHKNFIEEINSMPIWKKNNYNCIFQLNYD